MTVYCYPPAAATAGCTASVETLGSTDRTYPGENRTIRLETTGYRWTAAGTCDFYTMDRGGWIFKKWVLNQRYRRYENEEITEETIRDVGNTTAVIESTWDETLEHWSSGDSDYVATILYNYSGNSTKSEYLINEAIAVFDRVYPATGEIVRNADGTVARSESGSILCKGWRRVQTQYP